MKASKVLLDATAKDLVGLTRGILELHDIHLFAEARAQELDRIGPGAVGMRRIDADHAGDPVDVPEWHLPDDKTAPVMADEDRLIDLKMVEQADQIAGQVLDVVVLDRLWPVGRAVAALVRRDHADAGLAQRLDLVAPGKCEFGPAMAQHHRRLVCNRARLVIAHADSVRLYELERWHFNHRNIPTQRRP
ncbi:hypothetical protein ACVWZ6_003953 [Bradyrhizobium sp. GM6.1]